LRTGSEESLFELKIVGYQYGSCDEAEHFGQDLLEGGCSEKVTVIDVMDLPDLAARPWTVHQRRELIENLAVRRELDETDLDDPVGGRVQP
jgi:hypothetical protein